ncbi:MAG TPA: type III-A CRISPR-associated protein Cas10/Csm1 [Desulfobulbaceae bacterium]|nr:type III-A CRISPR-associated protein Cas10/Csm1 [Desulfobulbaceae bacterium]
MDKTVLKIALAGLCHDLGKFAQGYLEVSPEYRERNAPLYQPVREGRYSHLHALFTAAFIEQHQELLPQDLFSRTWGDGDIFLNIAACHHKPETPMQWIVARADRIASGLDRATFEHGETIAWKDFRKTRLLPIFEALGPKYCEKFTSSEDYHFVYPLEAISSQSIFPVSRQKVSQKEAGEEYRNLFQVFRHKLGELYHRDADTSLWAQHFDSLYMTMTSMIPAARVGDVVHDVSLYDHSRATAALAAALYRYHKDTNTLDTAAIKENRTDKLLLVSGDFYGIQNFIFGRAGESRRFRSKLLRGRSFAVALFTELAADLLCERLRLPFLSVVLNAAGKFHLVAANTESARRAIDEVRQEINDWLFKITYGQSSMGIIATPASPDQFTCPEFSNLWQRHLVNQEEAKQQKIDLALYGGAVPDFLDSFNNEVGVCPLCDIRPADPGTRGDRVFRDSEITTCRVCRDHVLLGTTSVKHSMFAICHQDSDLGGKGLLVPVFGRYQAMATDNDCHTLAQRGELKKLMELETDQTGALRCRATVRLINGYVPVYTESDNQNDLLFEGDRLDTTKEELIAEIKEGAPKTLNHIALMARHYDEKGDPSGTEALGILKADVDQLGMLLGCGLPKKRYTFSRLATLSRQLNNFFTLYLPHLLRNTKEFNQVYTVFAGGDDLFLIGPWNRMADLAGHLRQRFQEFVCGNPNITFSVGITLHKPHTPIDRLAEASEEALLAAKRAGRNRVTMFAETVTWDTFTKLMENRVVMEDWLKNDFISRVMFYRFNQFVELAEEEGRLVGATAVPLDKIDCVKWRAMFGYALARNVNTKTPVGEQALKEVAVMADWLTKYRGGLRIPLWQIMYEQRS